MCCPLDGAEAAGLRIRALVWSLLQMHLLHVVEGGLHAGEKQAANFALNPSLVRITVSPMKRPYSSVPLIETLNMKKFLVFQSLPYKGFLNS